MTSRPLDPPFTFVFSAKGIEIVPRVLTTPDPCSRCHDSGYVIVDGEVEACDVDDCAYWASRGSHSLSIPDQAINRAMDQADEKAAGPISSGEGASDQGDTYWIEETIAHLRSVGLLT